MIKEVKQVTSIEYHCDILKVLISVTYITDQNMLSKALESLPRGVYFKDDKGRCVSEKAKVFLPFCFYDKIWLGALLTAIYDDNRLESYKELFNGNVWVLTTYPDGDTDLWDYAGANSDNKLKTVAEACDEIQRICLQDMSDDAQRDRVPLREHHLICNGQYIHSIKFGLNCYHQPGHAPVTLGRARDGWKS